MSMPAGLLTPISLFGAPLIAIVGAAITMSGIVALRYLASSGGFALMTRARHRGLYSGQGRQIRAEIAWSLMSCLIYGVPAGVVAWGWQHLGWTRITTDIHALPLWWHPVSLMLFLGLHDTWFYWTHRAMHAPRIFRAIHSVHHASRPPTAWAAMSFHPGEALSGAFVIPALVFMIPVYVGVLACVLMIMTVMGVANHMGWEMFPRWLVRGRAGTMLITASHHQRHHQLYSCNYGLYFRLWDRICGTDRGLGDLSAGQPPIS